LLVVDESHFLAWEGFEALRRIHDSAQVGIVFLGMPRVYEAMRGTRSSYLYDQLYSRIGCKFHATGIEKADVQLIVDAICPNLPKACISLLFEVAQGAGRFRLMVKLLQKAIRIHKVEGVPITVELLKEVRSLLVL
jgi:DNA transposition AAA+ family ATPase